MDLSTEDSAWDNTESLYWERVRGGALEVRDKLATLDVIQVAKRRALTYKELAGSGGVYTDQDMVWHLPTRWISGPAPKMGDVLIDQSGARWTILELTLARWRNRWQATTRNLSIAFDLKDSVTIQTALIGQDTAGAPLKKFPPDGGTTTYNNLPARVQLKEVTQVSERGLRGKQSTYEITVDRQITISTEDRILWNGITMDVIAYRQAESIADLPIIDAMVKL